MRPDRAGLGGYLSRVMVACALLIVITSMALAGLGLLAAALYLGLIEVTQPALAALGTGGALIVVALLLLALAQRTARRRPRPMAGQRVGHREPALMTELGRSVGGEVASWARAHATGAALAA